jgi:multidrug efflux pump subunit AcrB
MEDIRTSLQGLAGVNLVVDRNQEGPPTGKPINLEIYGSDVEMKELSLVADNIQSYLNDADITGVEELKKNVSADVLQDIVEIDRQAANRFGVSTYNIANALRTALYGREATKLKKGEDEYPIMIRFAEEYRQDKDALLNQEVTFRNINSGRIVQIPISAVAKVRPSVTYSSIKHKKERRTITIYSNVLEGSNANEIVAKLDTLMSEYDMPEGVSYKFTGEQEDMKEAMDFLSIAFLIAIISIFLIMVLQFNSLTSPVIILATVLFSTIGVFLGYVFSEMDMVVIMTGIGIVSLAGVVVNNAIVLIDYTMFLQDRKQKEKGGDGAILTDDEVKESIINGGKVRLRPVLLTAITTVLGLIPLAIGFNFDFAGFITDLDPNIYMGGDNAAVWGPMAWTVVYGLTFATFLTLVMVPVMYWMVYRMKSFVISFFKS